MDEKRLSKMIKLDSNPMYIPLVGNIYCSLIMAKMLLAKQLKLVFRNNMLAVSGFNVFFATSFKMNFYGYSTTSHSGFWYRTVFETENFNIISNNGEIIVAKK